MENGGDGLDERVEFVRMQKYSPWHDVDPSTESSSYINCVIEIPVGGKKKSKWQQRKTSTPSSLT